MVRLVSMTEGEFQIYRKRSIESYARSMSKQATGTLQTLFRKPKKSFCNFFLMAWHPKNNISCQLKMVILA